MASLAEGAGSSTARQAVASEDTDDHANLVHYPQTDMAQNESLDKMTVGVAGRMPFQKIYVRAANGKKSTTRYNPEEDAPSPEQTVSILPTTEEKVGRPNTMEFLVVGLVLASDPFKQGFHLTSQVKSSHKDPPAFQDQADGHARLASRPSRGSLT
ncbi:hypothetical protein GTA08_BOTSDO07289 [Botryosphaeria dothidea]|uniref:Uncharacterized protein n=1 Tax=Botryosphaeria dothidea TaxID=55169 RepID=A0A8H4IL75_9PEZI|nr:hypothetical protein GTA08_BOTSDO11481 [Botryosphaeria dothidea]KAF4305578.1 hypothetical protein GTA08_BOTSDO07289 [Botryosphaeria dothidea]